MAHDHELAEVARHALRRRRNDGQGGRRGDRQQIPDPGLRRRRNRAWPAGASTRCRTAPSRCGHTASYYYFGKDPTFAFGTSVAVRPERAQLNQGWFTLGGGKEVLNEFYKKYNCIGAARRQHRLPDGRLVPQGDQDRRRSQGPEVPHRRISPAACCRSSAWCRSRSPAATSIRRWRRAPSTPPNGSAPMTTRSSASTRSRRTTTIPAGGKAARCCSPSSISTSGTRCRRPTRRSSSRPAHYANTWMIGEVRSAQSAGAQAPARRRREAARLLAGDHGSLLQGGEGAAWRNRQGRMRASRRCTNSMTAFTQQRLSVVPGRRIGLRLLHDPPLARLIGIATTRRPRSLGSGAVFYVGCGAT